MSAMNTPSIFDHLHCKDYLQALLNSKKERNARFSLRSLSLHLEVAPSTLSGLITGKTILSPTMASHLSEKLKLDVNQEEYLNLLSAYENSEANQKETLLQKIQSLAAIAKKTEFEDESFQFFNQWYHVAILELCSLPTFELTAQNVSEKIGISLEQAKSGIDRLKRLELIIQKDNRWQKSNRFIRFSAKGRNEALRSFHRQMLTRTITAIEKQAPEERYIGTETFTMPPERMSEARAILNQCFNDLLKLSVTDRADAVVFHAGAHLYQIRNDQEPKSSASETKSEDSA